MFAAYLNEKYELVLELAVPGRGGDDLDVRVNEDESVQFTMPAKADTPGSLLQMSVSMPIGGINLHWNVHEMRATCHDGLLTMCFPMKPESMAQAKAEKAKRPVPRIDPSILRNRFGRRS